MFVLNAYERGACGLNKKCQLKHGTVCSFIFQFCSVTHTHMHARAHARTHAHTHTHRLLGFHCTGCDGPSSVS